MSDLRSDNRPGGDITRLLEQFSSGDKEALTELLPVIYDELRRLAAHYLHRERGDHTLQATALVHEAYLRLVNQRVSRWQNRSHFFGVAAQAMRRILVDHARAHKAVKRGEGEDHVALTEASIFAQPSASVDLVALSAALDRLAVLDAQQARIVELRFFVGFSVEETADIVGVSAATIKRDWALARAWLRREIRR